MYPANKSKWRNNKSGKLYTVIRTMNTQADVNREKDFPVYVGYEDCSGRSWCRKLDIFLVKFSLWEKT